MSEGDRVARNPKHHSISPQVARALLEWCLPADSVEDVLGDLEEAFCLRAAATSPPSARRWYWGQTLRLVARLPLELAFRFIPGRTSAFSGRDAHHLDGELDFPTREGGRFIPQEAMDRYGIPLDRYVDDHVLPQLRELVNWYQPAVTFSDAGEWGEVPNPLAFVFAIRDGLR